MIYKSSRLVSSVCSKLKFVKPFREREVNFFFLFFFFFYSKIVIFRAFNLHHSIGTQQNIPTPLTTVIFTKQSPYIHPISRILIETQHPTPSCMMKRQNGNMLKVGYLTPKTSISAYNIIKNHAK